MVLPGLGVAGMERMSLSLADGLRRRGHDVAFTCTDALGPLAGDPTAGAVTLVPARFPASSVMPLALARHFRAVAPDLIHVHNAPWLKAAWAARLASLPVVHTLHGLPAGLSQGQRWLMRMGATLTDEMVTVSQALSEFAMVRLGVPAARLRVISNGIDVAEPTGAAPQIRQALGLQADARLVGIVARLDPVKDHPTLLKAFVRVVAALPNTHLVLIGEGREEERIGKLVTALALRGRVHLLGVRSDVQLLLRELDMVALSSSSEGLPMSLLEAMAASRPIVSTAVGDIPGLLRGGVGIVVPPRDHEALGTAIIRLLNSPDMMASMGQRARERVTARYGIEAMVEAYERFYQDTIARCA